jgi:enterochelin esterase-like enzyme
MIAGLLLLLLLIVPIRVAGQTPIYSPTDLYSSPAIAALSKQVDSGNRSAVQTFWAAVSRSGAPLIEPIPDESGFSFVSFLWHGNDSTRNVVIFDGIAGFDAKDRMLHLLGTDVWYKTYRVRNDARFAYNLSPNDSLQSFDDVKGDEQMRQRLAMLQVDPLNPRRCPTTFGAYGAESSYVELPGAQPIVWESTLDGIPRGRVDETSIHSALLNTDKNLWVYTPPGFARIGKRYPLLVLFDGDRNVMWIPKILDILIAQGKIPPMVAVMTDQSVPSARRNELPCNPQFADFLAKELVPWSRNNFHATTQPQCTVVAGSSYGGLASVFAGLKHPEVFGNVVSLSGSFWWKPEGETQGEWLIRQVSASPKLPLRFYLEVGLMEGYPMQIESNRHMAETLTSKGYQLHYSEYDGGHSFLNWSEGMAGGLQYIVGADNPTKRFDSPK